MMVTVPKWLQYFYPSPEWEIKDAENSVYITFDDGPHPEITPKVLDILDEYNAKATFFCVGDNVRKYPETYQQIIQRGHQTGNHTFNHLNGWKTKNKNYFSNIDKAAGFIKSNLFRPPYGKISPLQIKELKKRYRIIMWSVLTYDFNRKLTPEKCLKNALTGLKPGSIIVFHDSEKSDKNMLYALPEFLKRCNDAGLKVKSI
jgi:peptidoglycan/xylan/chitin deacetylase (PgdA/CDA1 family)